jgi:ectoine hydroxylase-related dioxygenase (phytanoyl-CoA dioxygenase family)
MDLNNEGWLGISKYNDSVDINAVIKENKKEIVKIASSSIIVDKLKPILGENILLWGYKLICQEPNKYHRWHVDVEHYKWPGVTVWLALKNLNEKTSISLITHSHDLPITPQELNTNLTEEIVKIAQKINSNCELKTLFLQPLEFIVWNGMLWHSTKNESSVERYSIVLQYCNTKQRPMYPLTYNIPNTLWCSERVKCILVSGVNEYEHNTVIELNKII